MIADHVPEEYAPLGSVQAEIRRLRAEAAHWRNLYLASEARFIREAPIELIAAIVAAPSEPQK